jgi:hypothetical protein
MLTTAFSYIGGKMDLCQAIWAQKVWVLFGIFTKKPYFAAE